MRGRQRSCLLRAGGAFCEKELQVARACVTDRTGRGKANQGSGAASQPCNTSCYRGAATLPDPPPQPRKRGGARPQCSGLSRIHGVPSMNREGLTERNQTQAGRPYKTLGNQGGASGKESACRCGRLRDPGLIPGSGRSPREGNGNPLQLPGETYGQRRLAGYSPWGCKESDTTEAT